MTFTVGFNFLVLSLIIENSNESKTNEEASSVNYRKENIGIAKTFVKNE